MSTRTEASRTGADRDDKGTIDEVKEKGQEIGREAKSELGNVVSQLKEQTRQEANTQSKRTADAMRGWSKQMQSMAESSSESGRAVDLARSGAEQMDRIADRLENEGLDGIIHDVESFARRRPGLFLAAGVGVGMVVGRLFRLADTSQLKDAMTDGSTDADWSSTPGPEGRSYESSRDRGATDGRTAAQRPVTDPGFSTGDPGL